MTLFADAIGRGLAAARPAVGDVPIGSLYYSTDTGDLERNSGSAWESVAPLSAPPSGAAGGVLAGTYPNPSFAADMATQAELDAHTGDTTAAHAASAIGFTPASGIAATDVQAAIVEDAGDLAAHLADTTAAHAASAIGFTPTGTIAATDAQAAIAEVASEAAAALAAWRLDQVANPTADVSLNSHKLTGVTDPTGAQDAATKAYVDAIANGLSVKAPVRAATTANGTLATAYENGDTLDGVTLATGDRILLKNQTTGSENGIYTVNASGAPTRATDADASAEVKAGLFVIVQEGTANADTAWLLTTNNPITLGTTALVFAQLSGGGGGSALTVEEVDGSPTDSAVTKIVFPNGTLSITSHVATYTPAGGSAITIAEIDGTPSGTPSTLQFPNGTITDQGSGVYRYTPAPGASAVLTTTGDILYVDPSITPGTDVALSKTTTANVASGTGGTNSGNVVDNNTSTYWSTVGLGGSPSYLTVDLGSEIEISSFAIMQFSATQYLASTIKVQGSHDNTVFTDIPGSAVSPASLSTLQTWNFTNPVTYRYFRLHILTDAGTPAAGTGIKQFSLYASGALVLQRLPIGTAGQVLTVTNVSGNLLPRWA